jgi:outer membrane protein assembly factor BamB
VTDRQASRGIKLAQQSIAAGEYSQAIGFLDGILGNSEDRFIEVDDQGAVSGLKETARRLIRDLPAEGRQAYETAYGPVAERLLKQAVEAGDASTLQSIVQRYFYTPAGYEAAILLAMDEADAGRHLSAALTYQQLLETPAAVSAFDPQLSVRAAASWLAAGDETRARAVLSALIARGRQTVEVAGRQYRLDDTTNEPLDWLRQTVGEPADVAVPQQRQWLTYRGNAARSAASRGGLPHMRVRWKVRLLGPPQLETLFENLRADLVQSEKLAPVASNLLAAGDYVLTRTPYGLLAVDFRTGKMVWRSEPQREPELERLLHAGGGAEEEAANPEPARAFARRIWEDYLYGLTSSDGERAYMIRDLSMPVTQDYEVTPFMGAPGVEDKVQANRLSAYELATQGKLVWEIDGAAATGPLAGAFFLGAPLPVGKSLYAMAEIKGAVYLVALDRETGEFQWQQLLANLETNVSLDMRRRLQSAMPSYDAGMLVCPTGAGVVVGVDLAKRSLAWAYQYETARRPDNIYRGRIDEGAGGLARRWSDNAAAIVDGHVLLTPPESGHLHCLELRTGKVLWKQNRGEMTRLAGVEGDCILLVGARKLRALRLADGRPAWKKDSLSLPRGAAPSGAGFISDGKYYLPLSSAEVIAVDMAEGRIVSRAVAPDGEPLGNLVCHRGSVISQSGIYLDCFDQVDVLRKRSERRLARDPDDVDALRTLGEVAYNDGRLSEAIDLLERAYRTAPGDPDARDVLAECLAAALDSDFASYRSRLELLKELQDGSVARRMTILRIEAQGMLQQGDPLASADACWQLYRLAGPADEMLELGRNHRAAVSRWVQSQLIAIWRGASDQQRTALEATLRAEIDKLGPHPSGDALSRALEFFGELPAMQPLKLARAKELGSNQQWLDAQQILMDLADSDDDAIRREATARLAARLHEANLHSLADEFDRELSQRWADEPCLDGATGRELIARWQALPGGTKAVWPQGRVEVRPTPAGGAAATARVRSPLWGVRLEHADAILGLSKVLFSTRGGELLVYDNYGREFFSAMLENNGQIPYNPPNNYGVSRGNLLVVSLGKQLAAVNTLAQPDGMSPAVLWRAELGSNLDFNQNFYGEPPGDAARRPGSYRSPRTMDDGKWVGVIGPVTSRGVVFQDQRRLVCVDPLSGEVRWTRSDVPQGCDLFGDDQYLLAVPTGSTTARIFGALDGRALGKCKLPPWREQLVTRGRQVIAWKTADGAAELSAIDAVSGTTLWRHEFGEGAAVDVEMGRYIAVVEPAGRAVVIDAADGKALVDQPVPAKPTIEEVHLSVGEDAFLLVVKHPRPGNAQRTVKAFNMVDSPVIDGQLMLFDRATGAPRWSRPAEVVQQALLLTQPADLPFIVFAGILPAHDASGSRAASVMLILDKATGRTLYRDDNLPPSGGGQCIARVTDADGHRAVIEMAGRTILLQFTDARRPPEPPAMAEVESGAGKSSGGLMGIILNLGGS